jgi:hypothetical protein
MGFGNADTSRLHKQRMFAWATQTYFKNNPAQHQYSISVPTGGEFIPKFL